ncbi:MAG: hypothetical protein R3F65_07200 [bacterium]
MAAGGGLGEGASHLELEAGAAGDVGEDRGGEGLHDGEVELAASGEREGGGAAGERDAAADVEHGGGAALVALAGAGVAGDAEREAVDDRGAVLEAELHVFGRGDAEAVGAEAVARFEGGEGGGDLGELVGEGVEGGADPAGDAGLEGELGGEHDDVFDAERFEGDGGGGGGRRGRAARRGRRGSGRRRCPAR